MVTEVGRAGSTVDASGLHADASSEAAPRHPSIPCRRTGSDAPQETTVIGDRDGHVAPLTRLLARLAVAGGPELDAAVAATLEEMARGMGLGRAFVILRDVGSESFSMILEWSGPAVASRLASMKHVPFGRYPCVAQVLRAGSAVQLGSLDDAASQPRRQREAEGAFGTGPLLILPLRSRGNLVHGALGLEAVGQEHAWAAEEVRHARLLAEVLAGVLERKRSEQDLRASRAQLLALLQLLPDIVSIIDTSGNLVLNSHAAKRIHGYDPEDLQGRSTKDKWHPEDVATLTESFQRLAANPDAIEKVQYRYRNKDGSYAWMEAVASNQLNHPDIRGIVCLSRDISDRKREEQERRRLDLRIQQLQYLESLGVLAGGVAHDFNNLLVAILGNVDLACAALPADSPLRPGLAAAMTASHRAADLARQLLAYAGKGRFVLESVDLGGLVSEMAVGLRSAIAGRASLHIRRSASLPPIEADKSQLRQVILDLTLNAAEAMCPEGGTITITTSELFCSLDYLSQACVDDRLPEGQYVLLEIADTGRGMDRETLARIFDPFFTTRFIGRGLGLAAVLGCVRGHKGAIRVSSELERGTTFSVVFPVKKAPAFESDRPPSTSPVQWSDYRVLLVDDDDMVREVGSRMLESLGFRVWAAGSGKDALAYLDQDSGRPPQDRVRLVVLDLGMPEMDGHETFERLRRVLPDLPVVIASGYTQREVMSRFEGAPALGFVEKPFDLAELSGVVSHALGVSAR